MDSTTLAPLVGTLRQVASVRRMTLQEGAEAGVQVISLSTGGGLDMWLLASRTLDIGALWFHGLPVAWQPPGGFVHPSLASPSEDEGRGIGRLLGGLLTTCGLDRVRQPGPGGPLHGRLGLAPARILVAHEDWASTPPCLEVVGEAVQYRVGGEALRLTRRITAPVGGTELRIDDTVTNDGPQTQPHDILYHFNFGYPAIAQGSTVWAGDRRLTGPISLPDATHSLEATCSALASNGSICELRTPLAGNGELRVAFETDTPDTLPWLQLWNDLRPGCGLFAIEPCASPRHPGGQSGPLAPLEQGQTRRYSIRMKFSRT